MDDTSRCRGRLAPSPTGYLHVGHARTFWTAQQRVRDAQGVLVLRNEDLDRSRCRPEFVAAMYEDLRWFGFEWDEGPDRGGPFGPYNQSERMEFYRTAFEKLKLLGFIYPCFCSRQDVLRSIAAPHAGEDDPVYPGTCRPGSRAAQERTISKNKPRVNWRFQVPDGEAISFVDGRMGAQTYVAGSDFGDFVVWRQDDLPAYQLAVVVDDDAMKISEVVRGEDLLKSTARQILLYNALGLRIPAYYHCALVCDKSGERLAKRHDSLSLRTLRQQGVKPETLRPNDQSDCD